MMKFEDDLIPCEREGCKEKANGAYHEAFLLYKGHTFCSDECAATWIYENEMRQYVQEMTAKSAEDKEYEYEEALYERK